MLNLGSVNVPNFSWMVAILVHHHVPILDNGGTGLVHLLIRAAADCFEERASISQFRMILISKCNLRLYLGCDNFALVG